MKFLQQALLHLGLLFRLYIDNGSRINVIFWDRKHREIFQNIGKSQGKDREFCLEGSVASLFMFHTVSL